MYCTTKGGFVYRYFDWIFRLILTSTALFIRPNNKAIKSKKMNITTNCANQSVCDNMTQIQEDLEVLMNKLLEKVGNKLQVEKQAEYTQALEDTKLVIEKYKSKYCS